MKKIICPAIAVILVCIIVLFYAFFFSGGRVTVKTVVIDNPALTEALAGLTVVFLSDLHLPPDNDREMKEVIRQLDALRPDLILLGGDYVRWGHNPRTYDKAFFLFDRLKAPLGVYAVMGDADYTMSRKACDFCHPDNFSSPPGRMGVTFLRNSGKMLATADGRFLIFGLGMKVNPDDDSARQQARLILKRLPRDVPAIILAHSSIAYTFLPPDRDILMLSGDTHGGQVLLPGIVWRCLKRKPDPDHMYGLFEEGWKSLYVTSGVGTSWPYVRLGVPAEIVVFKWQGAAEQ